MREANVSLIKLMREEQHTRFEKVWIIKHGLVHHSLAAGPAAT
jgi:hypothetical protein